MPPLHPTTYHLQPKGYILLLATLVVGALALSIAVSVVLLSTDAQRTSFTIVQSKQASALADACAEQALEAIREDDTFTGTDGLTLGEGTCTFTVTNLGGEARNIEASGTVGTTIRKVEVSIDQIYDTINIASWQEVDNF
ncbi:MAG: hypothetical protein ABIH67_02805 [Candidatus Uhrbacteria bacterium]